MNQPNLTTRLLPGRAGRGRKGAKPQIITFHIQDGIDDVWQYFQTVDADCTVWIKRTGEGQRFLFDEDCPWTNGFYDHPNTSNPVIRNLVTSGIPSNLVALTIENQGKPAMGVTNEQVQMNIELAAYWCVVWGIPPDRDHLIRHADLDSVNRWGCPGANFPLDYIISEVQKLVDSVIQPSLGTGEGPIALNGFSINFGFKAKFLAHGAVENHTDPVNGGIKVFGLPLSNEFDGVNEVGQKVTYQVFERAVFEFNAANPDDWKLTWAQAGRAWLAAHQP